MFLAVDLFHMKSPDGAVVEMRGIRRPAEETAELLREAVSRLAGEADAPVPKLPLFRSTGSSIAEDVDRALEGFGLR